MHFKSLFLASVFLVLAACSPKKAPAPDQPTIDSISVGGLVDLPNMAVDSNVILDAYWKPNDDGRGPLSGFVVYAFDNQGVHRDTLPTLPNNARSARIILGPYPSGTFDGQICVVALRRQFNSTPSCEPWTKTFSPPTTPAPPMPMAALVATAVEDTARLALTMATVPDAFGPIDALFVRVGDNQNMHKDSVQVASTTTSLVMKLAKYVYGSSPSGYACVYQVRGALRSEGRCLSWSLHITDVPPPPVIIDSVIVRLEEVAYINGSTTNRLYIDEALPLGMASVNAAGTGPKHGVCVFAHLTNGKVAVRPTPYFYKSLSGTVYGNISGPMGCDLLYTSRYTSTQRNLTGAERTYVQDRVRCLRWHITGAGITTTRPKFYSTQDCDVVQVEPQFGPGSGTVDISANLM